MAPTPKTHEIDQIINKYVKNALSPRGFLSASCDGSTRDKRPTHAPNVLKKKTENVADGNV